MKKDLIAGWKKAEQRKNAYVSANEKLVDLNNGKSLKNAKTVTVSRTEGAPIAVLNAAFANRIGSNTIAEDGGTFYVLHVEKNVAPKSDSKKKEEIRKELQNFSGRYVSDDYGQFLKREYPVKVNQRNFDKITIK